jgi:hypothetical protein
MFSIDWKFLVGSLAGLSVMASGVAFAGPAPGGAACDIGKGITPSAVLDVNSNRSFDGVGGGDANFAIAAFDAGADSILGANLVGTGQDVAARYTDSTATYVDANGNYSWDGVSGGDESFFFAPGQGFQTPVVGDFSQLGTDQWGLYNTTSDAFVLDLNDNRAFDGISGGDANYSLAFSSGPGIPFVGDFDGDGAVETGKLIGPSNNFVIDLNGNNVWDGNSGGDFSGFFAPGQANSVPVIGDWNGDGSDDIGIYTPGDEFQLDFNGNLVWDGVSGGDRNVVLSFASGAGIPVICDWDGDGSDEPAKIVGADSNWIMDLNGDLIWSGNSGGDFNGFFGPGSGTGEPIAGVWTAP